MKEEIYILSHIYDKKLLHYPESTGYYLQKSKFIQVSLITNIEIANLVFTVRYSL